MKKKYILALLLCLLPLFGIMTACDGASAPETAASEQKLAIRLATDYRKDSIGYQQLLDFAHLLQEKSGNTMIVQLYSTGEWSTAASFLDYVKLGSLEMACLLPETANQLQPAYELYQQPYLFSSLQTVQDYIAGENGRKALGLLPEEYYGIGFVPDGYLYLLDDGQPQWISYGQLKQKGQTKALEGVAVYDLQAVYGLQPLVTTGSWWNGLSEEQQGWLQESFAEALTASFAQQEDKNPSQTLLSNGVVFEDVTAPAWNSYSAVYLNQREAYFAAHSDSLTAYWRPVAVQPPITGEEEPTP